MCNLLKIQLQIKSRNIGQKYYSLDTHTLFELHSFIRRVLSLNLSEAIWVSCEIHQLGKSRGHYYLTLVQKHETEDEIVAQADAVLWLRQARKLRRSLGKIYQQLLQEGTEVRLQVMVDFHERYGYKLIIQDIDPAYTLGKMALQRQHTLEKLKKKGLFEPNKSFALPAVIQKVAIISSTTAAGLQDFIQQLEENPYAYKIGYKLFEAAVQGINVQNDIPKAIKAINNRKEHYHAIIIIRGGGSRLDLAGFDEFVVCEAVAQAALPVITGIGHERDEGLIDMVANTSLKTPTAVADFIVNHNRKYEQRLEESIFYIHQLSQQMVQAEHLNLQQSEQSLKLISQQRIQKEEQALQEFSRNIPALGKLHLISATNALEQNEQMLELLSLEATLQRGYTIAIKNGKVINNADQLKKGDIITNRFKDGDINSKIV